MDWYAYVVLALKFMQHSIIIVIIIIFVPSLWKNNILFYYENFLLFQHNDVCCTGANDFEQAAGYSSCM